MNLSNINHSRVTNNTFVNSQANISDCDDITIENNKFYSDFNSENSVKFLTLLKTSNLTESDKRDLLNLYKSYVYEIKTEKTAETKNKTKFFTMVKNLLGGFAIELLTKIGAEVVSNSVLK